MLGLEKRGASNKKKKGIWGYTRIGQESDFLRNGKTALLGTLPAKFSFSHIITYREQWLEIDKEVMVKIYFTHK